MPNTVSNTRPQGQRCCPRCGGTWRAGTTRCWLCGAEVQPAGAVQAATPSAEMQERLGSFSLASLMMLVTLVAVVCGTFTIAPGLGIIVSVVATLAFVRTVILVHRQSAVARHPSAVQRAVLFAGSIAVIMLTGVAAATAFYATCVGGFSATLGVASGIGRASYGSLWLGLILGVVLGITAALYLGYRVFILLSKGQRGITLSPRNKVVVAGALVLVLVVVIWLYLHDWRWFDIF